MQSRLADAPQLEIEAEFCFGGQRGSERILPGADPRGRPYTLVSRIARYGKSGLNGESRYVGLDTTVDPLASARAEQFPHWFVAGYGVHRALPEASTRAPSGWESPVERLAPLFAPADLMALSFARELDEQLAAGFTQALNAVVEKQELIPGLVRINLNTGRVQSKSAIVERNVAVQRMPDGRELEVPASGLSHGFQSSLAWLADLVGHLILEAQRPLKPADMEGLVLIDELDLYLHPRWQVGLVAALRETFPRLQFITTTHSPILLTGLRPDEVLCLGVSAEGAVQVTSPKVDPRLQTGTELYKRLFNVSGLHPSKLGRDLHEYGYLAANPFRTDEQQDELEQIASRLRDEDIDPGFAPTERKSR